METRLNSVAVTTQSVVLDIWGACPSLSVVPWSPTLSVIVATCGARCRGYEARERRLWHEAGAIGYISVRDSPAQHCNPKRQRGLPSLALRVTMRAAPLQS